MTARGYFDDFRASIAPTTAKQRLKYFQGLLDALKARDALRELSGKPERHYGSPEFSFKRLLRAHIDFAEAQVAQLTPVSAPTADRAEADGEAR